MTVIRSRALRERSAARSAEGAAMNSGYHRTRCCKPVTPGMGGAGLTFSVVRY